MNLKKSDFVKFMLDEYRKEVLKTCESTRKVVQQFDGEYFGPSEVLPV